ncbi:MAG: polysaccharide deacetylase family protein [Candidatus Peribacter sp.]|nr:polysaccharide deacetylase family protein [Candidatus Peribacter sp.]
MKILLRFRLPLCSIATLIVCSSTALPYALAAWELASPSTPQTSSSVSSTSFISSVSSSFTLPTLTYHYVESAQRASKRSVALITSPVIFEKQLLALQERGYKTIFVSAVPGHLVSSLHPSPAIALTFDDGYQDFYVNVFPLLKKYQAKATLYVVPAFIGKQGYLTQEELKDIVASGLVEIGAHTLHHKNLVRLSSTAAQKEIAGSKEELERDFGVTVTSFAYPFGAHTPRIEALVGEAGFTTAVTTQRGWDQSPESLLILKRIPGLAFVGTRKWKAIGDTAKEPSPATATSSSSSAAGKPLHRRLN